VASGDERLSGLEEKYDGYTVYDDDGEKIGKVDELFVDENDREEYIGVKMGLLGLSGTTLIPMEIARVDERNKAIRVAESKERVKDAPNYSGQDDIDSEYENRVRRHFALEPIETSAGRGTYGRYSDADADRGDADQRPVAPAGGEDRTGGGPRRSDREEAGEEPRDVGRRGYRERGETAAPGSAADQESATGQEVARSEPHDREEAAVGYRGEAQGQDQDVEVSEPEESRRRRVRRRMIREESEEEITEEGPGRLR